MWTTFWGNRKLIAYYTFYRFWSLSTHITQSQLLFIARFMDFTWFSMRKQLKWWEFVSLIYFEEKIPWCGFVSKMQFSHVFSYKNKWMSITWSSTVIHWPCDWDSHSFLIDHGGAIWLSWKIAVMCPWVKLYNCW